MNEITVIRGLMIGMLIMAVIVFLVLFFMAAPYGRHIRRGWGPTLDNRKGWLIMEAPASLVFALCFLLGGNPVTITLLVLFTLWQMHYVHRAFIYPFRLHESAKRVPLVIIAMGMIFNTMNAYLNGRYIFTFSNQYDVQWLGEPRFIIGVILFITGFIINRRADGILRNLRKPGETGYKIADTGLYHWISCPNYLGEILIWTGWAIATWSMAGLVFAVWTAANLVPRARSHHEWYRQNFPEYPAGRKALIPRLW